jgi:isoprenylcysteine carboxyl methyltransferase (ICMT) family protein YpbQ
MEVIRSVFGISEKGKDQSTYFLHLMHESFFLQIITTNVLPLEKILIVEISMIMLGTILFSGKVDDITKPL